MNHKNIFTIYLFSILVFYGCKNETVNNDPSNYSKSDDATKQENKLEKDWKIFDEEIDPAFNKTKVYVRLEKAIDEQALSKIAHQIKDSRKKHEKVYIFYLLPDQEKGKGAWAYSHFTPQLEIKIQGTSIEEAEKLNSSTVSGEILSKWEDTQPYVGNIKYLVKENGELFMKIIYKDGSKKNEKLSKVKYQNNVRYNYKNKHGEFYVVEANGNLGYYDSDGKFYEAKKIK